jgi:hypothetical protein
MQVKEMSWQFELAFPTTLDYERGKRGEGVEEVLDLRRMKCPVNEILLKMGSFETTLNNIWLQRDKFTKEDAGIANKVYKRTNFKGFTMFDPIQGAISQIETDIE